MIPPIAQQGKPLPIGLGTDRRRRQSRVWRNRGCILTGVCHSVQYRPRFKRHPLASPLARVLQKCSAAGCGEQNGALAQIRTTTSFSRACVNCNTQRSPNRLTLWGRYLPRLTPVANGGFFLRNAVRGPRLVSTSGARFILRAYLGGTDQQILSDRSPRRA
jgi:hypothetical protein